MVLPARARIAQSGSAEHLAVFQRRLIFRLKGGSGKDLEHSGRRGDGRQYHAGDTVRQSGIYEVIHDREHRATHEVVMISNEQFPDCESCKDKVRFRLVRTAPYIFQDEDFEEV